MSAFAVTIDRINIEPHPNADAIELARVGDYVSIVKKGQFKSGDLAAYIPEAAIVPDPILEVLGLKGKLSGKDGNRVKAIKLRGVLSQGLVYPVIKATINGVDRHAVWSPSPDQPNDYIDVAEGDDVAAALGITKYEPPVPAHMAGQIRGNMDLAFKYDIENVKKYGNELIDGEKVVVTEKLHGTLMAIIVLPKDHPESVSAYKGRVLVSSKGLLSRGQFLEPSPSNLEGNLYWRALLGNINVDALIEAVGNHAKPAYFFGEVLGQGVQDLGYGQVKPSFRLFDAHIAGGFVSDWVIKSWCSWDINIGFKQVPVLYTGPYSKERLLELTNGKETLSGNEAHIREGVVVRPITERKGQRVNRVVLKSISEAYLLRKGGTEFT